MIDVKCGHCGEMLAKYIKTPKSGNLILAKDFKQIRVDWIIKAMEPISRCPKCGKKLNKFKLSENCVKIL